MPALTTHVGSLPRPENLDQQNMEEAVFNVVKMQVEIGLDEINDGEYRRAIFFGDITGLPGFRPHVFPITASAGDQVFVSVVESKVQYDFSNPVGSKEVEGVKKVLEKLGVKRRIKISIPSLSWMSIFYPDERTMPTNDKNFIEKQAMIVKQYYPTLDDYLDDMKKIIINEARASIDAGAETVQFDSPDLFQFDVYGQYLNKRKKDKLIEAINLNNEFLEALQKNGEKASLFKAGMNRRNVY